MLVNRDIVFKEDLMHMANKTEQKSDNTVGNKVNNEHVELELSGIQEN